MIWQEDSLTKMFRTPHPGSAVLPAQAQPANCKTFPIDAARNEVVSAQYVVEIPANCGELQCKAEPLIGPKGVKIKSVRVRYVGYVPLRENSDASGIRPAPVDFPDPLFETALEVQGGNFQPVWITIAVPKDAPAGKYSGKVTVTAGASSASLPLVVNVHNAVLSDRRTLMIANWITRIPAKIDKPDGPAGNPNDESYWRLVTGFAKNMGEHRQNVILTPVRELTKASVGADDKLAFDFSRLDRWVKVFTEGGVLCPTNEGIIEGGHLANGKYGATDHTSPIWVIKDGKAVEETVSSWSKENHDFIRAYLPALQAHLEKRGWLAMYRQHVFDEPVESNPMYPSVQANAKYYIELAKILREVAPKIKTIEATHTPNLVGCVDTWVPETDYVERQLDFYKSRQKAGDEVWFYICLNPHSPHLNRFIDYPLLMTRLQHWANFKYQIPGFLHWGWNCWPDEPYKCVARWTDLPGGFSLPPGDSHLVYPKPDGGVLDSIRSEAMLEGIQDYELLQALAAKDAAKAQAICDQVLQDWTHYTLEVDVFRGARKQLLEALSEE